MSIDRLKMEAFIPDETSMPKRRKNLEPEPVAKTENKENPMHNTGVRYDVSLFKKIAAHERRKRFH